MRIRCLVQMSYQWNFANLMTWAFLVTCMTGYSLFFTWDLWHRRRENNYNHLFDYLHSNPSWAFLCNWNMTLTVHTYACFGRICGKNNLSPDLKWWSNKAWFDNRLYRFCKLEFRSNILFISPDECWINVGVSSLHDSYFVHNIWTNILLFVFSDIWAWKNLEIVILQPIRLCS